MIICETIQHLQRVRQAYSQKSATIAFIPTMGNLHDGHLALIQAAQNQKIAGLETMVSIFVNPLQFGAQEDFGSYPRTLEEDVQKLQRMGVSAVFTPSIEAIYPDGPAQMTQIHVPVLSEELEGHARPGHFTGVATVVAKLFLLVNPDLAMFGEKDFQQLCVVRKMVDDLAIPVKIVSVPTQRDSDGLALSSRNRYLDAAQRKVAPRLHKTLQDVALKLEQGQEDFEKLQRDACSLLENSGFIPEYVSIRNRRDLTRAYQGDQELIVLAAAYLGGTRLIDNVPVTISGSS